MSSADEVLRKLGGKSNVQILPGEYRGLSGLQVTVDFGGGLVPADSAMEGLPVVGDPVWVMTIDGHSPMMLGYTTPKPGNGTVTSATGNTANVSTAIGLIRDVPFPAGLLDETSVDAVVKLFWSEGPFILAVMSEAPAVDPGEGGGGSSGGVQERLISAIQTGSYRSGSGWWQSQVWASDGNLGIWGYGSQIPDTVPATAVPVSIEIWISPVLISGDPPNFGVHGLGGTTGAPEPTFALVTPVPVTGGWVRLPDSFLDALKAGSGFVGVGVAHGGFNKFASRDEDAQSGRLRIRWR